MKGKEHQFRGDREYSSAQEVEGKKGQPAEGSEPWSVQSFPLLSFPIDLSSLIPLTRCRPYPEINYPPRAHMEDNLQIVHSWSILHSQRIADTIQRRNPQLPRCASMLSLLPVSNLVQCIPFLSLCHFPSCHGFVNAKLTSRLEPIWGKFV